MSGTRYSFFGFDPVDKQYKNDVGMELCVWVLEDAEKPEWSKYAYTLWDDKFLVDDDFVDKYPSVVIVGVSSMGEIILSTGDYIVGQPFYVFYFNPEKKTLQRVKIQGCGECDYNAFTKLRVYTFVNHVEDLNVNDAKILNSSIYAPYVKKEEEDEEESKGEEDRDDH
ncbi:F-box associated domain type 3 [Arabidopsis thaliana x Arabidopsis arenosa]|uniref:F-box associated domain type 3 n=1 Tax=Arabidopsis thaliana x Arabidopsis arenosa TaxID=1240361 RepID=A0A8T1Y7T7_9BRAS|nr:F-box associated domain type 3 [Arabidopsis thaliana x Arabidopsis arenosa]